MKHNLLSRALGMLLALTMLVGMIPATTLTASAAEITDADISKFEQYVDYMKYTWKYYNSMNLAMITDVEIDSTGWLPNAFTAPSRYYNSTNSYSVTVNPQTGEKTYSYDYSPVISYGAVTSSQSKELSYETFPGSTWIFADESDRNDYGAAYLNQLIAVFNVSTREFMEDPNNLPAGAYITGFRFNFVGGYHQSHLSGFPTATDYGVDLNEYINITVDGKKATRQEGSVEGLSIKRLNPIPYTYQVTDTLKDGWALGSYCDALSDAMVWGPVVYVYDEKPEIKSVTVNGTSVADGGTFTANSGSVAIKTTYDSVLSQALQDYGCSVKQLSAYYLNGEKINVAALTPVSNGNGTSTKTYSRTLNGGDVLKVESWLEVTWPDGSKDVVDERTVTVMNVGVDFQSISPVPTSTELTNKYTDLGTMQLGSAATNIEFKAFPKKLSAAAISDGWTTGRSISVTRDGVEIYNRTYADNDLYGWNLKDNIDEGGTYLITLRVFAQKGEQIVEKTHKFRVYVKGSTIKTIVLEGVGTPIIGKSPSTINTVKSNTDGVVVKRVIWNYWTSEMGGNWFVMPSGSKFEAGKRYAVEIELQTADGYSFTANKSDMTVYINGEKAGKSVNYDSNKFSAELEFEAITTPEFTTQPVGGEAPYGGKYTVNWATNFTPCKIVVGEYNSLNQVVNQVEYSNTTTSVELPANRYGYVVIAYYNDANAKYSKKITITETIPAFTTQPVGGEVEPGEKLTVTWVTNFTPKKLQVLKYSQGYCTGTQNLDVNATTANVSAGDEYCIIRAYYSDSNYVDSNKFTITEKVSGSGVTVSGTVTSFNSNTDEITVALYKEGSASADYTATVKGNSASYTLSGVAAGTYTMKVSKNNHVTREYALTVGTGNVTQDVKIHLKGDINGDGRVNTTDVGRANAHAKKTNLLSGYELSCADVSGDGKVNTTDVGRMNAHAKKTNLMW